MSNLSTQASAFYKEVAKFGTIWSIRNKAGFPVPQGIGVKRVMPFWSTKNRAVLVIKSVPAYKGFEPTAISWADFCTHWVPGLTKDNFLAGINWSGKRASGFDIEPVKLQEHVNRLQDKA